MVSDAEGFWKPQVDASCCIDCGLCQKYCPGNTDVPIAAAADCGQKFFAAWNKNRKIRDASSSGGVFSALAEAVLKSHGAVFGVRFDREYGAKFDFCENLEDLPPFRGSKYVQCYAGGVYPEVKKILDSGRKVLFSGSPCQVAALRSYLKKDFDNLFCVDIICHGVPSPQVFLRYLREQEKSSGSKITDMKFRDKSTGWDCFGTEISYADGRKNWSFAQQNPYMAGFLHDIFIGMHCHNCRYTSLRRTGDLTIADFWGYIPTLRHPFYWHGVSQVIVNSLRGTELLSMAERDLCLISKKKSEASQTEHSLARPFAPDPHRQEFFADFNAGIPFMDIMQKYFPTASDAGRFCLYRRVVRRAKNLVPANLKAAAKKFLGKHRRG